MSAAQDSRWVLVSEAAAVVGVSPQALRDRIRRKTLETMPSAKGLLVRPCDCVKKMKSGRKAGERSEADRKAAEQQRRIRARMFWLKKTLYGLDQRFLLDGCSLRIIKQECRKVRKELAEPVEVERVEIPQTHGISFPEGLEG